MARALARGLGRAGAVHGLRLGPGAGARRARRRRGASASNRELAERADLVVLAHKPAQLEAVAREIAGTAKAVVSILARTTQAELRAAYPDTPVFRVEPNTPVEVRRGVLAFAEPDAPVPTTRSAQQVRELFGAARHGRRRARGADADRRRDRPASARRTGRCSSRRRSTPASGAACRRAGLELVAETMARHGRAAARRAGTTRSRCAASVTSPGRDDRARPRGARARRRARRVRAGDRRRGGLHVTVFAADRANEIADFLAALVTST